MIRPLTDDGTLTVLIAKIVGDTGRVFSNEVNSDRVQQISRAVENAGLKNVTVLTGQANDGHFQSSAAMPCSCAMSITTSRIPRR